MLWKHPWISILYGPTGCDKIEFVKKFLMYIDCMNDTEVSKIDDYAGNPKPKLIILDV